jgi:hypothetical protein
VAEEGGGEPGLQGYEGGVIDVAPGEVLPADEVVEFVAGVAVTEVRLEEVEGEEQEEFDRGEEGGEA